MTLFLVLQQPWPAMVNKIENTSAFEMCDKGFLWTGLCPRAAVVSGLLGQPAVDGCGCLLAHQVAWPAVFQQTDGWGRCRYLQGRAKKQMAADSVFVPR